MRELVLDLVESYEHRVSAVDSLIISAFDTTTHSDDGLLRLTDEREELTATLRETLARGHSLRRKDFDTLIAEVLTDIGIEKNELEDQRRQIRDSLRTYLEKQKDLVIHLKQQLLIPSVEEAGAVSTDRLQTTLNDIKRSHNVEGEQIFSQFRNFQLRLEAFRRRQTALNDKLRRLVETGELLTVEDLRQLRAAYSHERRLNERKARKQDLERLLSRYSSERRREIRPHEAQTLQSTRLTKGGQL